MTHLTVVNGPKAGNQFELARGETCTIGSDRECAIQLGLPGVAPVHAEVKALREAGFGIKRAEGPVAVNGATVEAARLADGDVIDIGGVQILYGPPELARARGDGGRMLGGFRLMEVLGQGGMGTVHRAEQVSLHRQVALKVLDAKLTQNPVFVARFVAEARAAARLHHPNVVQVYDVGNEGSTYYYSMELMKDGSVEDRLKALGKLDLPAALKVIADAAAGLAYAESLRIVHRDIKPDNLMLDHHGHAKLADLGLALTEEDTEGKVVGTPHFMSPEQILRKPLDHRSDLYSLGCTFYRLLAGRNPYSGTSVKDILRAQVKDEAEPLHKVDPTVPAEVSAIVQRLMAKAPEDRFQSATELKEALDAVMAPKVRRGLLIGGIVAALLIAGSAIAYAVTRPEGKDRIIETVKTDPEAEANAKRARELEGQVAYLQVRELALTGEALAAALDAMAAAHPDTEAAGRARTEAQTTRDEVAAAKAAAEKHKAAVAAQEQALRDGVRAAIVKSDFAAAMRLLTLAQVAEALRGEAAVQAAKTSLTTEVRTAAATRLGGLRQTLDTARAGTDPAAIEAALAPFEAVLAGETAWPAEVLTDRDAALATVASARQQIADLQKALADQRAKAAWSALADAHVGTDGVLAKVTRLQWRAAASAAQRAADAAADQVTSAVATGLAASLQRAVGYLDRYAQAAAAGSLSLPMPGEAEPCPVASFTAEGEQAGWVVKVGPRHQPRPTPVPFASLEPEAILPALALPGDDAAPAELATVLGWLELAQLVNSGRAYLRDLDPQDDASGVAKPEAPPIVLQRAQRALANVDAPWAAALRDELAAAALLVDALQALRAQRNLAAAEYSERLVAEHAHRLVVLALR